MRDSKRRPFLIESLLPSGSMHIIGAAPGAGKSILSCQLAACLVSGEPFLSYPVLETIPAEKIYFIYLDRPEITNEHAIVYLPEGVQTYTAIDDHEYIAKSPGFLTPLDRFKWLLNKVNPPKGSFVVIDVFGSKVAGDIFNSKQVDPIIEQISYLVTHRYQITLLAVGYGVKVKGVGSAERNAAAIDNIQGCASFRGAFDVQIYLARSEEHETTDDIQLMVWKERSQPGKVFYVKNSATGFDLVDKPVTENESANLISDLVLAMAANSPVSRKEILAEAMALSPGYTGLDMLLGRMVKSGALVKPPHTKGLYLAAKKRDSN